MAVTLIFKHCSMSKLSDVWAALSWDTWCFTALVWIAFLINDSITDNDTWRRFILCELHGLACDASVDCVIALYSSLMLTAGYQEQTSQHILSFLPSLSLLFSSHALCVPSLSLHNQRKTLLLFFQACGYKHAGTELMAQTL